MLVTISNENNEIPVIKFAGNLGQGGSVHLICAEIIALRNVGRIAVAIDLTHAYSDGFAGAFAVVEISTREAMSKVAFFGAPKAVMKALTKTHMNRFINIHETQASAQNSIATWDDQLSTVPAIILCAGSGTRMSPISNEYPKPMLDILGKPIVERLIDHLSDQGVRRFILNPGHLGPLITDHVCTSKRLSTKVQLFPEGDWKNGVWNAQALGSASTLVQLRRRYNAIGSDIIVMCGDALTDIDVKSMLTEHRKTGSDITIAAKNVPAQLVSRYGIIVADQNNVVRSFQEKPTVEQAKSNLANVGIYIISADCLNLLPEHRGLDIAENLLSCALTNRKKVSVYTENFAWHDMGCGKDYFSGLQTCLEGCFKIEPVGRQIRPGIWVHNTADVSPKAEIQAPCYVGAESSIAAGARIFGATTIGKNCRIDGGTIIQNSTILDNTSVSRNAYLFNVIASPTWKTEHLHALGRNTKIQVDPLLSLTKTSRVAPQFERAS